MPLLKSDALPIPPDEVQSIRTRLTDLGAFETVDRDGRRYLFVRTAAETPHPVADVETAVELLPPWVANGLNDVFLLGTRSDLHVPAAIARPVLEAQLRLDSEIAQGARARLPVQYGLELHRTVADPQNRERLLIRIPRERTADLTDADLQALAEAVGPRNERGDLRHVRACYLIANQDHAKFRVQDLLADLVERWSQIKPRLAPPPPAPQVPPPPRVRRTEDVRPAVELDAEVHALGDPDAVASRLAAAQTTLAQTLVGAGYKLNTGPFPQETPFSLQAHRASSYPRRVSVVREPRIDAGVAQQLQRWVREHKLDLLVVLTLDVDPDAVRRLTATKVKVIKADEVGQFVP